MFMMNIAEKIRELLLSGLTKPEKEIHSRFITELVTLYASGARPPEISKSTFDNRRSTESLLDFLGWEIGKRANAIDRLKKLRSEYDVKLLKAFSEHHKIEQIMNLAKLLGSSGRDLNRDRDAFKRWFGYDTVLERLQKQICESEYQICFLLGRIKSIVNESMTIQSEDVPIGRFWRRAPFLELFNSLMSYDGDSRVRVETYRCLHAVVSFCSFFKESNGLSPQSLSLIYRSALDSSDAIWVRIEALKSLSIIDTNSYFTSVQRIFDQPVGGENIFLRRAILSFEGSNTDLDRQSHDIINLVANDPSPYVRQGLVSMIVQKFNESGIQSHRPGLLTHLMRIAIGDDAHEVRSYALNSLDSISDANEYVEDLSGFFTEHFRNEGHSFVLLTGLETVSSLVERLSENGHGNESGALCMSVLDSIENLHETSSDLTVRRRAAMARELMLVAIDPVARELKCRLARRLQNVGMGESVVIPLSELGAVDDETLGRVLSCLSQDDLDLNVTPCFRGVRITRGEVFGFRFWRLIHELRNPMPDKRQGFSHTLGRISKAQLRAPSNVCCELTETRVPGEPLYMKSEGSWRPYLPLVDHVATACSNLLGQSPLKLYTAEGITEVTPPRSLIGRLKARLKLIFRFSQYARLRNWDDAIDARPESYVEALDRIGVKCRFIGHRTIREERLHDRDVLRFFPAIPGTDIALMWTRLRDYFFSAYENSLYQLGILSGIILGLFVSRLIYVRWSIKRARKSFALSIGGWGTRGKSGVERLKTALFEALGHSLMAKTTGCEAMFLHSHTFGKAREMSIFRPYDKATIWEHYDMMLMGKKLKSRIFLWECMGLNPSFVKILQRQWSVDDYATLTNAYPDHEDIQGPAGINIPVAMESFIPKKSVLVTSEREMEPVLRHASNKLQTRFVSTDWKQAGMLTRDVLERFPYEEHPSNISLLLTLVKELGIDPNFALKEMADRVVPDIGVLKSFQRSEVLGRYLEFVNGMSANERYATLSNWVRMGFDNIDMSVNPDVLISTIVNNRADRLSRSRMFASILVNDLKADYHFLIGSNISGLKQFISEEWEILINNLVSQLATEDTAMSESVLIGLAKRLRVPISERDILGRLNAIVSGLGSDQNTQAVFDPGLDIPALKERFHNAIPQDLSIDVWNYIEKQKMLLSEFLQLQDQIRRTSSDKRKELGADLKTIATKWFMDKFVVIDDYHASGNQIINIICSNTPPGLLNRIMGLQNIKGTGLDFVYTWQSWETCHALCSALLDRSGRDTFEMRLNELSEFSDYNLLCEKTVKETLKALHGLPVARNEIFQSSIAIIESRMNSALESIRENLKTSVQQGFLPKLASIIESILDVSVSVKRRRLAQKIYRDLVDDRISHERAALELRKLNRGQTSGWLFAWYQSLNI